MARPSLSRRPLGPALILGPALSWLAIASLGGCVEDYAEPEPPSLDDAPEPGEGDELAMTRTLNWWTVPTSQRAELYYDGARFLLLRKRWDRSADFAWAEGELTPAGQVRLDAALAAADPSRAEPAPGSFECVYSDRLPVTIYLAGEAFSYRGGCPPEGLVELAALYEDIGSILLECPSRADEWYDGELPLISSDCQQAED